MEDPLDELNDIKPAGTSGALTSGDVAPIWEVPVSALDAIARRMGKGHKYPLFNWRMGLDDIAFLRDRTNHTARHLLLFSNGSTQGDDSAQGNVDAVAWWVAMMSEALRLYPETVAKAFYAEARGEKI